MRAVWAPLGSVGALRAVPRVRGCWTCGLNHRRQPTSSCCLCQVGDSKAVLARRETDDPQSRVKALNITKDHTCIQAKERERIVKAGGFIENNRVRAFPFLSPAHTQLATQGAFLLRA